MKTLIASLMPSLKSFVSSITSSSKTSSSSSLLGLLSQSLPSLSLCLLKTTAESVLTFSVSSLVTFSVASLMMFSAGLLVNAFQCQLNQDRRPVCLYSGMDEAGQNTIVEVDLIAKTSTVQNVSGMVGGLGMARLSDHYYYWAETESSQQIFRVQNQNVTSVGELPAVDCGWIQGNMAVDTSSVSLIGNQQCVGESYCIQKVYNFNFFSGNYSVINLNGSQGAYYSWGLHLDPRTL